MSSPQIAPVFEPLPATPSTSGRVGRSFASKQLAAARDTFIPEPPRIDNGDEERYADKSGTYTKGVKQSGVGLVDLSAYDAFRKALDSGRPSDFENIPIGGTRTLNGPQGGLAFDLEGLDSSQFFVPPAAPVAAKSTLRNWSNFTGPRCCVMWRLLIIRQTTLPSKPRRNSHRWRITRGHVMLRTKLRRNCCSAAAEVECFQGKPSAPMFLISC